ncbi:MAG: ABC transporter ATP-binding protein [Chloroflexi bacterium]|nr:ABC transporter ATP-binding protein [Chloroflexota bacterium]
MFRRWKWPLAIQRVKSISGRADRQQVRDDWEGTDQTGAGAFAVCQGLVKIYKVADLETVALQGLDLEVRRGEILGVIGNSGSGKSTLLNILGGLDLPSAGRVFVGGQDLLELSDAGLSRYRREKVGFVWQQSSRNLIPYLTALENVQLPMMLMGKPLGSRTARARELLASVGLEWRMSHRQSQLSGGEQQRVAIAVAMANAPEILLADEPTGEVDTDAAIAIYGVFHKISRAYGTTVIIVSHDRTIGSFVDRVVAVRDGKVSTEATRRERESDDELATGEMEELVVLDSAGRLQIPRELIERFGLKGRVRVEAGDGHIAIVPVEAADRKGQPK